MSEAKDDNWEMPKPVFRSSTGALPKSFEETISQSFSPDSATVEIDEDDDILSVMDDTPERSEDVVVGNVEPADSEAAAKAQEDAIVEEEPKAAVYRSFSGMFLLLAALGALVAVLLIYYLTRNPASHRAI